LAERLLQGLLVVAQHALGLAPAELTQGVEASGAVECDVAFGGGVGDAGQPRGLGVGQSLADEPEDFHPLLDARVRVFVAFPVQGLPISLGKR
jgi:hypothetical protein